MRRPRLDPFDRRSMALSAGLHMIIVAAGWASTFYEPPVIAFETYEIELVSPPPAVQAEVTTPATEEIVVERPDPEPTPPEPEVEEVIPVEEPDPDPPPEETDEQPEETTPEVAEEVAVAAAPTETPEEEPEVSGEDLNVRIEGLRRDYPQYYENIIRQIQRCFRWDGGGNWQTTVFFFIERDGTVTQDIQFVTRSGSNAFDFASMGATECAGQGRFGPLPEDVPYERFPVRFRFQPRNAPLELLLPAPPLGAGTHGTGPEPTVTIESEYEVQESS